MIEGRNVEGHGPSWSIGRVTSAALGAAVLLGLTVSCSGERGGASSGGTGEAVVALGLAPTDALCLEIQVAAASTTVSRQFALTVESNTTFFLSGLPFGADAFSAEAFDVPCAQAATASPTWTSDVVNATVAASAFVHVTLHMQRANGSDGGGATVAVDFAMCGPVMTAFPNPAGPVSDIVTGPDGNLWATSASEVIQITPSGTITPFPLVSTSIPLGITPGIDGNLWFVDDGLNSIDDISVSGKLSQETLPTSNSEPLYITSGPDGNLWFTEPQINKIGKREIANGMVFQFPIPTASSQPNGICAGPDGNVWFAERSGNNIAQITTDGTIKEFPIPTMNGGAAGIVTGPDGNLWFTEEGGNKIGMMMITNGQFQEYELPSALASPTSIVVGPDGNLWFTEETGGKVGQLTTAGSLQEFVVQGGPSSIAAGPDGNMWVGTASGVVRITPYTVCTSDGGAM
jgi:streptogramin lyase